MAIRDANGEMGYFCRDCLRWVPIAGPACTHRDTPAASPPAAPTLTSAPALLGEMWRGVVEQGGKPTLCAIGPRAGDGFDEPSVYQWSGARWYGFREGHFHVLLAWALAERARAEEAETRLASAQARVRAEMNHATEVRDIALGEQGGARRESHYEGRRWGLAYALDRILGIDDLPLKRVGPG